MAVIPGFTRDVCQLIQIFSKPLKTHHGTVAAAVYQNLTPLFSIHPRTMIPPTPQIHPTPWIQILRPDHFLPPPPKPNRVPKTQKNPTPTL